MNPSFGIWVRPRVWPLRLLSSSSLTQLRSVGRASPIHIEQQLIVQEVIEKTEAELAAQAEKRKEQGKRLQEMQVKMRADKVRCQCLDGYHRVS
jgi:hypothetical protein